MPKQIANQRGATPVQMAKVAYATGRVFGVRMGDMKGDSMLREICNARHTAAYVMFIDLEATYSQIGRYLKKDHSSIIYAVRKVNERMRSYQLWIDDVRARLAEGVA